ncbi:MAG: AAA family ATPase, partial [Candidatus Absconditabacteria bacterium]
MYSRTIEAEFLSWMEREEILIITGSRQVGKTSFMKHIQGTNNFNNEFFNLEDFELLSLFNESPKNLIKLLKEKHSFEDKIFVFIDEIQYLNNPSNFLKYIYDEYKDKIKLIVSGSSAFY